MIGAREMRKLTAAEVERVRHFFAPDMDGESFIQVLTEARYELLSVNHPHPSGISYQEAFAAALRYWTMPYRGRMGGCDDLYLLHNIPCWRLANSRGGA